MSNYENDVIWKWDDHSELARIAVENANSNTKITKDWIVESWVIKTWENVKWVITSIDWVGTKTQIYTNQFELLIKNFEKTWENKEEVIEQSTELWTRMLHDLVAMNVDDLRLWEMSAIFTNIVDINHLNWIRWKIFSNTFPIALANVIEETWINSWNGETAILWESQKFLKSLEDFTRLAKEELEQIEDRRKNRDNLKKAQDILDFSTYINQAIVIKNSIKSINQDIRKSFERMIEQRNILKDRMNELEFNIGWTGEWIVFENDKLVEMEAWQRIVYFAEKPTEDWIISPRSNWITRIRELMHNIGWKDWENKTFEEFLENIWEEKSSKIPNNLKSELKWLKMWNIATWKTTVFNPFISKKLLGWIEWNPIANISSLIHITWNPLHKISSWIKKENLMAEIDMTDVKIPQIIELLQHIWWISDEDAMSSWNMWTPYAVVCDENDVDKIIEEAKENWFVAKDIWEIKEKEKNSPKLTITWVWINNSYIEKLDKAF